MLTNKQILSVNIISIIISALIIRVIYVSFDCIKIMVEEIVDDSTTVRYRRSKYYTISTILIALLCGFLGILIYQSYVPRIRNN